MADLNREALEVWNSLKPMIDKEITDKTQGMVQRRKAKVTTAPSLVTNTIGVTEAFGQEIFLPFVTNIASAKVGDLVWIEWMYGASNAFVSSFAEVDKKDFTVAGTFDVLSRRCYATLSSVGWYRIMELNGNTNDRPLGAPSFVVDFTITRSYSNTDNEVHKISLVAPYNNISFENELSKSNTAGITKIRYTRNGTHGYVDIYYGLSASNQVIVDFDVHVLPAYYGYFVASSFSGVAPSPSGETVMTEYTFAANTNGDTQLTATTRGSITYGKCYRVGNINYVNFVFTASESATNSPQIASVNNSAYDTALSAIDITSGIGTAITSSVPCGVSTLGKLFLKEITSGHIYAISGFYTLA